jgi:hypothetical protein
MDKDDKAKLTSALRDIRLRIDRCMREGRRPDRQAALEDVDGMLSNLSDDILRGRL